MTLAKMQAIIFSILVLTTAAFSPSYFRPASQRYNQLSGNKINRIVDIKNFAVKPDLFSGLIAMVHVSYRRANFFSYPTDDLFGDDSEDTKETPKKAEAPKKSYLDEKWALNKEDAKEFKGFPTGKPTENLPSEVPIFALMYKFRREYFSVGIESSIADHRAISSNYKRLINSEVISLSKGKGAVLLWAGFTEADKEETKEEIMTFMAEDPLILKDIVENWDLIDLTEKGDAPSTVLPPRVLGSSRAKL